MSIEIERKFIVLSPPPDLHQSIISETEIHQTYLAIGDEEVRVRRSKTDGTIKHSMAFKRGKGLVREEVELSISEETYAQLLSGTNKKPLMKVRKRVNIGDRAFELDVYPYKKLADDKANLLMIIETEFTSEEEANAYIPEAWFSDEVTIYANFKNQHLWKQVQ
jgi:adenylate cyclase